MDKTLNHPARILRGSNPILAMPRLWRSPFVFSSLWSNIHVVQSNCKINVLSSKVQSGSCSNSFDYNIFFKKTIQNISTSVFWVIVRNLIWSWCIVVRISYCEIKISLVRAIFLQSNRFFYNPKVPKDPEPWRSFRNPKDSLWNHMIKWQIIRKKGLFFQPPQKVMQQFFWGAEDFILVQIILFMQKNTFGALFRPPPPKCTIVHNSAVQCTVV